MQQESEHLTPQLVNGFSPVFLCKAVVTDAFTQRESNWVELYLFYKVAFCFADAMRFWTHLTINILNYWSVSILSWLQLRGRGFFFRFVWYAAL